MNKMKEHFSSRVTKLLVILALAIVASVMFVFVGCGETHVHAWTESKEQAATCTEDGWVEYTCEGCGDVRRDVVQATGHTWDSDGTQGMPATCTDDGWYYYRHCTVCGSVEASDRIAATGHTIDFKAATTKVTMPYCTTAGSVTGVCTVCGKEVTYTSAQIAANKDANGLAISIENQPKVGDVNADKEAYYGAGNVFLGALGHDYSWEETHTCVAHFDNADKDIFGEDAAKDPSKYYYDYCKRCETAFEVEAHKVPTGYNPCEEVKNPNNPNEFLTADKDVASDVIGEEYASAGEHYAYVCSECKNYIAATDHSYKLMSLVSGTPNSTNDPAEWEAAPADAEFSCLYYEVCEWCGLARISKPHTPSAKEATCTEAVTCTVCHALVEAALGHENNKGGPFGDITKTGTADPTCTTGTITYKHCWRCENYELQGQEVEWVLGENYTMTEADNAKGHQYEKKVVYDTTVDAVGCARPYWYQDVCSVCKEDVTGHIRVMQKPTVYTRSGEEGNYTYTAVTDSTLQTSGTTYYIVAVDGKYVPFTDIANYNANKYVDEKGVTRFYTDENGRYDRRPGGTHVWGEFLTETEDGLFIDYENNSQFKGSFVQPTCKTPGKVLYQCSECGEYAWRDVDLTTYLDRMATAAVDADKSNLYPAAAQAAKLAKYHEGTVYTCGHAECDVCKTQNHDVQYSVSFAVSLNKQYANVTTPGIDTFYGWTCWTDTYEKGLLTQKINDLLDDDKFTFEFFSDAAMEKAMDWTPVGVDGDDNKAYSQFITVYVKATPKEAFTVIYDTSKIDPSLAENDVFENYIAYVAQTNKAPTIPSITGKVFKFYTDNTYTTEFNFSTYNWNAASGTITIYVK